ncbi:MAG: aminodeoxychorismate synthase component I [Ignavibacteriae bacterium HGW-Ignavibacteriae-3]|nr:MAG: aminodeoxychorismate synthase component I [Ignavibacteriae bacterium HGW-Ignavibacteriae-3]
MSYQKTVAINLMNEYGRNNIPFLFIIDFEMNKPIVVKLKEIDPAVLLFDINGTKNYHVHPVQNKKTVLEKRPVSIDIYKAAFNKILSEIKAGNSYLLNLTFPTNIETNLSLDEIFFYSRANYKLLYKNMFVVFSPESFVKISDGIISSYPMKGTIDALIKDAQDLILGNEKETAEHTTIVDLIRNDLSIVAKNVKVEKFRYVDKIVTNDKTLLQVSSKITGMLDDDYPGKIGDIIFNLLPAGSISGAPKKKTVEIIKDVETYSRGFYTGIFGCFDGSSLDSGVMIRFIEKTEDGLIFKSGGGITYLSNPESEYQELIDKVYVPIT